MSRNKIYIAVLILSMCSFVLSCSDPQQESDLNSLVEDSNPDPDIVPWTPEPEPVLPECIECKWYFCPPFNEIWKNEICFNICEDPQTLYSESECIQYMECDPSQYLISQIECIAENGYPGLQDKVCDKGLIGYTNCVSNCNEESCNYVDDDCDGFIDEGQLNICGACGVVPFEECNDIDDNCNGLTDEDLDQQCSTDCGSGYEICVSGNWISCTAPQPKTEICDGFDNDCDGQIDEDLECICTLQDVGVLFPCQENPLICGQGYKTCQCTNSSCTDFTMSECNALCYWIPPNDPAEICDPAIGMSLSEEKCNNFDDDCNQMIDEDLYTGCYTGPPGTLMSGICIPGEMTCLEGTWGNYDDNQIFIPYYCEGEVVPQEEICNDLDDDCDGITDWGEEMKETDVLFIVDWSGSMGDEMSAVMIALNQFAQNFSEEEVMKWAFIRGPVSYGVNDERLELLQDLTGFSNFLSSLSSMGGPAGWNGNTTAFEMLLDAIYISVYNITSSAVEAISNFIWVGENPGTGPSVVESSPPLQNFNISWRPGANRVIIVFTDELPQSYLVPNLTVEDVKTAVSGTPQLKLYTFSRNSGAVQWKDLAATGNGKWFYLTNDPTLMYVNLMEIIDEVCAAANNE